MDVLRSSRAVRRLGPAVIAAGVLATGACTSDDAQPPPPAEASGIPELAPELFGAPQLFSGPEWITTPGLLTHSEVIASLAEPFAADASTASGGWQSVAGSDDSCAIVPSTLPAVVPWGDSVFYTFEPAGGQQGTDVVECTYGPDDPARIAELYAQLEAGVPSLAGARYEPAAIGVDAFGWELDGGGGAIDRVVVVSTGDRLVGVVANRHSPVAEDGNLTRSQVDALVRAAVEKSA